MGANATLYQLKYKGRSFNSYHMAVRNLWKLRSFHGGVVLNNGTKFVWIILTFERVNQKLLEVQTCAVIIHLLKSVNLIKTQANFE